MKDMFRMFAFVGVLTLGGFAFAEENTVSQKPVDASEGVAESIQVVCPENCEDCAVEPAKQPVENAEEK